jgi:hypothetical protein
LLREASFVHHKDTFLQKGRGGDIFDPKTLLVADLFY